MSYGIKTPDLMEHCDGCGAAFDIYRALDCKKGGLVMAHHNKLCDEVANLASKAFTPTHIHDAPQIYTGPAMRGWKDNIKGSPKKDKGELKGGLLIRDLWMQGTDSIHNMNFVNTNATSYQCKSQNKFLKTTERAKKNKYLDAYLN